MVYRDFLRFTRAASARDIAELWSRRLAEAPEGHPIWMHVHVPYCPQLCTFCHCGRQLLTSDDQLDAWVERARREIAFFGPALRRARVRHQYFGGGTPNLLSPDQLDALLDALEAAFDHDPAGRRTLEVLPSAHQPGTLAVAARHGVRRLSCGVQTTAREVLDGVGRAPDLARLAEIMREAGALGLDDVNVDLAWGLRGDDEGRFYESLAEVFALDPTTVTVHMLAPTPKHAVFEGEAEERALYRRFRALPDGEGARRLAAAFPAYRWRKLPTVLVAARADYLAAGRFHTWQYSDMETVGVDSFGLGTYAQSHLLGRARYENVSPVSRFDPDERGYRLMTTTPAVDGAMDALAALARDGLCDLAAVAAGLGGGDLAPVAAVLDGLVAAGHLSRDGQTYARRGEGDALTLGPLAALFDLAAESARALNPLPSTRGAAAPRAADERLSLDVEGVRVEVALAWARPGGRYYAVVGGVGFTHGDASGAAPAALRRALGRVADALAAVVAGSPATLPEVRASLLRRLAAGG